MRASWHPHGPARPQSKLASLFFPFHSLFSLERKKNIPRQRELCFCFHGNSARRGRCESKLKYPGQARSCSAPGQPQSHLTATQPGVCNPLDGMGLWELRCHGECHSAGIGRETRLQLPGGSVAQHSARLPPLPLPPWGWQPLPWEDMGGGKQCRGELLSPLQECCLRACRSQWQLSSTACCFPVLESSAWHGSGSTAGLCASPLPCLATAVPRGEARAQGFV